MAGERADEASGIGSEYADAVMRMFVSVERVDLAYCDVRNQRQSTHVLASAGKLCGT